MEAHLKTQPKSLIKIRPPLLHKINSPIIVKHGQSNTELQALKNYVLNIEAQMPALKNHVKCELSTLANKTETMSLNLWKNGKFSVGKCK